MVNRLDEQYQALLQDILDNGVTKADRTGTGTISVFGRQIRHKMSEGFPLLTTKKMPFKTIVTELLWFLKGDTNIKYLVDNNCHIWDGDAHKGYEKQCKIHSVEPMEKEKFISSIKLGNNKKAHFIPDLTGYMLGDLGPVYGKQWRNWSRNATRDEKIVNPGVYTKQIDQITNLINELKTKPDSRRLMVNAWNVGEIDQMVLPPCHYGFQVYTRELSLEERRSMVTSEMHKQIYNAGDSSTLSNSEIDQWNVSRRAISLMWNQRSVDTFLGLPFNIASYGLLLEIIAKMVNMVPDELIGNLGDTHLYSNHVEQAKEQIGRDFTWKEQVQWVMKNTDVEMENLYITEEVYKDSTPKRTRQPFDLPTLNINTEFWPTESGECGVGPLDATAILNSFKDKHFCGCLLEADIQLANYRSHPTIKAPLSN